MDEIQLDGPSTLASARTDLESQTDEISSEAGASVEEAEVAAPVVGVFKVNKKYMMTPCNHSYHSVCLKKWMDIRMECPTCRQAIPVLDDD